MSKWEWKKLGEVCEIHGRIGWQGLTRKEYRSSGDYLLITGINFTDNNTVDYESCVYVDKERYVQDQYIQVRENDLLITKDGTLGKLALIAEMPPKPATLNGGLFVIRNPDNKIYPRFLMYVMKSEPFRKMIRKSITGSTVPHLTQNMLVNFPIPIPSLSEQRSIVKQLDEKLTKIEKIKTNAETNLKNAKALYQKSLDKIIEDECRRYTLTSLKEITTKIGSGATPKGGKKSYQTEGISLIRSMNVLYGSFSYDNLAHINEKQAKALDGVAIQCADVLFNITGASIARCCVVPDDVIPARVNQHVSILRPIQKVLNSDYLSVVLLASQNQKKLLDIGEAGATRQALTKGDLEVFPIPLPPLSVQKEIVVRLDKLSENVKRLEANYKQIIANCDELKKTTLKQTFQGGN